MTGKFADDLAILKRDLTQLAREWEGKASVLALQAAHYNAGQTEWWAFYFEHLCFHALGKDFTIPGEKFGRTTFDMKRSVNWDLKAKAIKSDDHRAILNDKSARELRTNVSRYRKTHATLNEILFLRFTDTDLPQIGTMRQGRNSIVFAPVEPE